MKVDFRDPSLYVDRIGELTKALHDPSVRYIFLKGGSGAGKSYTVAQVLTPEVMDTRRVGFFRKVANTLKPSVFQLMKDVKARRKIPDQYLEIKESKEIRGINGWLGMMFWLDDEEKIKSLANFDWLWLEEATEFTFDDFQQLDLRLRGGENHKMILTFNPVSSKSWIKTEIEDHPKKRWNAVRISKTARDNRFVDKHYLATLEALKYTNETKYKIYALNQRGEGMKWAIFPDYEVFQEDIQTPDSIGLDFGFNDPNALVYLKEDDVPWEDKKRLYIQEKIYIAGQTSRDLIAEMDRLEVPKDVMIYADSARPEMIADISKAGYMIEWIKKYKGSKQDQIDTLKTYSLYVNWPNILKEFSTYTRKLDKNNNPLDVPNDGDDHTCDASCYGATHFKQESGFYFDMI